jgi:hypothetical protein
MWEGPEEEASWLCGRSAGLDWDEQEAELQAVDLWGGHMDSACDDFTPVEGWGFCGRGAFRAELQSDLSALHLF